MTEGRRSKITDEHRQEAAALKALWDDGRLRKTQAEFGEAYGLGNQANVGHYLLARSPLNVKAALAFATELNCKVAQFSPRIAAEIEQLGVPAGAAAAPEKDVLEEQLLQMFRALPQESKDMVLNLANGLYNAAKPGKSEANPWAHVAPPPTMSPPPKPGSKAKAKGKADAGH